MRPSIAVTVALLLPAQLGAQSVIGTVFLDRNGNGRRDAGEPGLSRVVVSDQATAVRTDTAGRFRFDSTAGFGMVFVSLPDGYRTVGRFWKRVDGGPLDFALAPVPRRSEFSFIHASDTHLDQASLPRIRRFEALVDSLRPDFVLLTGDLVRDALRVSDTVAIGRYEMVLGELARFGSPVWTTPGNHDIFGIERALSRVSPDHPLYARAMYRHYLGPDYYSFNYGGVHFVGLNSVDYDDLWYYGHVDSVQVEWLKRDLALVPAATPVVTFNHIPFFTAAEMINGYTGEPPAPTLITVRGKTGFRHVVSNAGEVLGILRAHRYPLALGGHLHLREILAYELGGQRTRFEQAAAVVGPSDGAGLHFRSGITVYRVRQGEIGPGRFIPLPDPPPPVTAVPPPAWVDTSRHRVTFVALSPEVRLELLDWGGTGEPMLFLSGLDDTGHEFDNFAPKWTGRFRVLALTRRGFGASSQPPGGYQIDSLANDIRVVLDSLHLSRVILVGHSIAGDELTRFAATWPERVSRLVYLDAAHDRVPLREMLAKVPFPAPPPMTAADSASPIAVRDYNYRSYGVRLTLGEILSIAQFGTDGRYLRDLTPPTIDQAILGGLEHPLYGRIRAPALALYSVVDSAPQMFPGWAAMDSASRAQGRRFFEAIAPWAAAERDRFHREVANGRLVELHGAHHYLFISNEAEVMREMEAFLSAP